MFCSCAISINRHYLWSSSYIKHISFGIDLKHKFYKRYLLLLTMKVRCKKCKHSWGYKGKSTYYVTCPHCYNKVNVKKKQNGQ